MAEQNTNIEVKFLEYHARRAQYLFVCNQETQANSFFYPNWETLNWEILFPPNNSHTRFHGKIARDNQLHIIDLRECDEAQGIAAFNKWEKENCSEYWETYENSKVRPAVVILLMADPNFDQQAVSKIFNTHKERFAKIEAEGEAAKAAAKAEEEREEAELEAWKTERSQQEVEAARKAAELVEMAAKMQAMQQTVVAEQPKKAEAQNTTANQEKVQTPQQITAPEQQHAAATTKAANQRFHEFWMLTLKSPWTYLNPTTGVLMMSLGVIIGGLITAFGSAAHLTAATPYLTGMITTGAIWAVLTFPLYAYRECRQHFNAWRMKAWEEINQSTFTSYEYYRFGLTEQDPNIPGFGQYVQALPSQIFAWMKSDPKAFFVVSLALATSILLLVGAIGFFTNNPLLTFMAPLFDVMNTFISGVLKTLNFPITTPIVNSVSAILIVFTTWAGANLVRLIARADNQARRAGGSLVWGWTVEGTPEIGFEPDDPKNNFEVALDLILKDSNMMSQGKNPFYNPSAENDGGPLDELRKNKHLTFTIPPPNNSA